MSIRLATGGRLIDRSRKIGFSFNGKRMSAHPGDTLAAALMANGQMIMGRSFKYHRPRGVVASGAEEPNALVNLGMGARHEPNQRATLTEVFDGLQATSQNHWPSLNWDIGEVNALIPTAVAGRVLLQDLHPSASVLETCLRAVHPPIGGFGPCS